jgi:serine/threonine-protein kinase
MTFASGSPRVFVGLVALALAGTACGHTSHSRISPTTTAPPPSTSASSTTTRPRPTVTVPNVIGKERAAAVAALTKLGLAADVTMLANANLPSGFVLSQSPITGTLVTPGTSVLLVVSAPS